MFAFLKPSGSSGNPIKGFKVVRNSDRLKKYGIAVDSFSKFKEKIMTKFGVMNFDLFLSDGSLIDDEEYFLSLPPQTTIIIAENGEEIKTDLEIIMESFRKMNHEVLTARDLINDFLANNQNDFLKALGEVQNEIEHKTALTARQDDPSWFEGMDPKLKFKEEVMKRKAQDRIRGYFYKTKDELTKSQIYRAHAKAKKLIEELLSDFFLFLNGVDYFSCLFDRSHEDKFEPRKDETDASSARPKRRRIDSETKAKIGESNIFKKLQVSLCDSLGTFDCNGIWNANTCSYQHQINPYQSRESVILFQIYNLDHQIEISRSIFPSILKNIEELSSGTAICVIHKTKAINISVLTYFREIFTVSNLKLVHIVCHDKSTHEELKSKGSLICNKCDEYKKLQKIKLKIS